MTGISSCSIVKIKSFVNSEFILKLVLNLKKFN